MEYRREVFYRARRAMKRFAPGLLPTLTVLIVLPLMVGLGFWQLSRGQEKRAMLASYAAQRTEPPSRLDALPTDPAWQRVQVRGHFDAGHSLLLDNSIRDGKVGVELIQPFQDQLSGQWVLLNRGWLPWPDRRVVPAFDTPAQAVSALAWVYVLPATFQLQADAVDAPWPRVVTAVEPDRLWAELGRTGFSQELRMESGSGAYRLDWPVVAMGPEKHLGYAVQWFAMATALLGLYLYLGWHRGKNNNNSEENAHGSRDQSSRQTRT